VTRGKRKKRIKVKYTVCHNLEGQVEDTLGDFWRSSGITTNVYQSVLHIDKTYVRIYVLSMCKTFWYTLVAIPKARQKSSINGHRPVTRGKKKDKSKLFASKI